jgi:hypothetical protein
LGSVRPKGQPGSGGRQVGRVSDETLTAISRYLHLFIV